MQINQVKRNTKRARSVQVGRGGTRGKTSGRGHKGQKQHGGHGIRPDTRDLIKKLPKLRGRGVNSNKSIKTSAFPVNIGTLDKTFDDGATINPTVLFEKKLVKRQEGKMPRVKILATGDTKKKFTIERCEISDQALKKIQAAGGKAEELSLKNVSKNNK